MVSKEQWKIGELAQRTGLTVRALHHYHRKGLVTPSKSSESGHRLYTQQDIAKLQQVLSLKQMGFTLDEIKRLMQSEEYDPAQVLSVQLQRLQEEMQRLEQLYSRLKQIHTLLSNRQDVTTDKFLKTIEVMNMDQSSYFTQEQLEKLKRQSELLGPEKIKDVENEWPKLIAKVRAEMDKGTAVDHPEVVTLAKRWQELMNLFSGGDPAIVKAAEKFHAENPGNALQNGMDGELYKYITQAMAHI